MEPSSDQLSSKKALEDHLREIAPGVSLDSLIELAKEKRDLEDFIKNHPRNMPREILERLLKESNPNITLHDILEMSRANCFRPKGYSVDSRHEEDERSGATSIYSHKRALRPKIFEGKANCPTCTGNITGMIAPKRLINGEYAFATINPYSALNPDAIPMDNSGKHGMLRGLMLICPSTTRHEEVDEMSYKDHARSFEAIGDVERILLQQNYEDGGKLTHMMLYKNAGAFKNNIPTHGAYQIMALNMLPQKIEDDIGFRRKNKETYVDYLKRVIPEKQIIKNYGTFTLAVPIFIRRPLEVNIYPNSKEGPSNISDLTDEQRYDLSRAISDVTYALRVLMPAFEKTFDYSLGFHLGNSIGQLYVNLTPNSQKKGEAENEGVFLVDGTPAQSAKIYQDFFSTELILPEQRVFPIPEKLITKVKNRIILPRLEAC